ncbi:unnamed protein product [Brachionus calyciflorus]|uniref:Uncharacterized protein n=1 Tax=Brachionus calyciflorus TaxID=104777 RepID=A0A813XV08_9BILA|nr:unnamed protein product [Brachionus calyciflorus]
MENTLTQDRGQNLFTTSTHTGHHWRPGYYFPSTNFKPVVYDPIPQALNVKDEILPEIHFQTTNKVLHDNKFPNQDLYNDPVSLRHAKPLPSYKVNYMYEVVDKLNAKPRRPLTMAFQESEYKKEFEPREDELTYLMDRPIHRKNYLFDDEVNLKLTEKYFDGNVPSDVPPSRPIDPAHAGVLNLLDPYMTTYNKEHKKWKKEEWQGIAKKDPITIYNGEHIKNTPNILPESKPMKDDIWFKSEVKHRQAYCPPKPVPNSGLTTEFRDMFIKPSDVKTKEARLCPIDTPFNLPDQSTKSVYVTPEMYKSEYTNIGKGKLPINQF